MLALDLSELFLEFKLHGLAQLGILSLGEDQLLLQLRFLHLELRDLLHVLGLLR